MTFSLVRRVRQTRMSERPLVRISDLRSKNRLDLRSSGPIQAEAAVENVQDGRNCVPESLSPVRV